MNRSDWRSLVADLGELIGRASDAGAHYQTLHLLRTAKICLVTDQFEHDTPEFPDERDSSDWETHSE